MKILWHRPRLTELVFNGFAFLGRLGLYAVIGLSAFALLVWLTMSPQAKAGHPEMFGHSLGLPVHSLRQLDPVPPLHPCSPENPLPIAFGMCPSVGKLAAQEGGFVSRNSLRCDALGVFWLNPNCRLTEDIPRDGGALVAKTLCDNLLVADVGKQVPLAKVALPKRSQDTCQVIVITDLKDSRWTRYFKAP